MEIYGYTEDKETFMDNITAFMNTYGLSENIGSKEVVPLDVENVEEEGEKDA